MIRSASLKIRVPCRLTEGLIGVHAARRHPVIAIMARQHFDGMLISLIYFEEEIVVDASWSLHVRYVQRILLLKQLILPIGTLQSLLTGVVKLGRALLQTLRIDVLVGRHHHVVVIVGGRLLSHLPNLMRRRISLRIIGTRRKLSLRALLYYIQSLLH